MMHHFNHAAPSANDSPNKRMKINIIFIIFREPRYLHTQKGDTKSYITITLGCHGLQGVVAGWYHTFLGVV